MFTITFENGILNVFKDNNLIVIQPFKPTSTGLQELWASEEEALIWWNTVKHLYDYELPVENTEPSSNN